MINDLHDKSMKKRKKLQAFPVKKRNNLIFSIDPPPKIKWMVPNAMVRIQSQYVNVTNCMIQGGSMEKIRLFLFLTGKACNFFLQILPKFPVEH
jgi:hypothetical protein